MEATRREFALQGSAAFIALSVSGDVAGAAGFDPKSIATSSWSRRFKRAIQLNWNERDPEDFDVKEFADFLKATHAEVAYITVSCIYMFYPSQVPDALPSRWLQGRDMFGACCDAAKANGTRIMARLSPNLMPKSLADKHPDWFRRDTSGNILPNPEPISDLLPLCQFSSYFDDTLHAIIRELLTRYPIDGVYMNGWPSADTRPCYCAACRKVGDPQSADYRIAYQKRTEELWARFAKMVADHRPDMIFSGNLGGRLKGGTTDLSSLMDHASIFTADNQGRAGKGENAWDVSQQCRLGNALMKGRTMVNIVGGYQITGEGTWRNVTGNPDQIRQRLCQSLASGASLWFHWLGQHQGFKEDRRWQKIAKDFYDWQFANDRHFHNLGSLASIALVVSQHSNRFYKPAPHTSSTDALEGMYEILVDARMPFDIVVDSDLNPATLAKYKVLVLPNLAWMSNAQVAAIREWAARGGSLFSSFETALYSEDGIPRSNFGFAALYGIQKTGDRTGWGVEYPQGGNDGPLLIQRLEAAAGSHPVTAGFVDTNWISGGSYRVPFQADGPLYLTHVDFYPQRSPEEIYPRENHTRDSVAVFREIGASRHVYFGHDIDACFKRTNAGDLRDILAAALRWISRDEQPVTVKGDGLVEIFGWVTEPGYAVHMVNYSYPNFKFGPQRHVVAVGPQQVRISVDKPIRTVRLLQAGQSAPFRQNGAVVEFTVPNLHQYEVAALEV
jgi:hypothetical protein